MHARFADLFKLTECASIPFVRNTFAGVIISACFLLSKSQVEISSFYSVLVVLNLIETGDEFRVELSLARA
jgi:hypothetical protein